jgi:glycine/D-amino acid oxidase-like deaminating enzyme
MVAEVAEARAWGRGEDELVLLDAAQATDRLAADGVLGGTWTPDCAAVHPLRLVRGLAEAVERRGGVVHERTRVTRLEPGRAVTRHGTVRAEVVVRATEAWTPRCPARGAPWCRCTRWSSPPTRFRRRPGGRSASRSGRPSPTGGT